MIQNLRIGEGFDVHKLVVGRPLVLGGVEIPFSRGLDGHSDADVLIHAICDALLGAAALGDIGSHFPDDSLIYKNISSLKLLSTVGEILQGNGFRPVNIDSTLVLQAPRVSDHIYSMRKKIATAIKLDATHVSVKATTTEELGFIGRGEGIAARAIALVIEITS